MNASGRRVTAPPDPARVHLGPVRSIVPLAVLSLPSLATDLRLVGFGKASRLAAILLRHHAEPVRQKPRSTSMYGQGQVGA